MNKDFLMDKDSFAEINEKPIRDDDNRISYFQDDVPMEKNPKLQDKVTHIRRFLEDFQKRLEGYEYVTAWDKISYTGKVLCGSLTIQKLVSSLSPFAENSNLISQGKIEDYYREKHELNSHVNEILLADNTVSAENYKTIMKAFKNTFKRIGNIINTSRDLMRPQFVPDERFTEAGERGKF